MENKLTLPCELPEGFRYTKETGLTQEEAEQLARDGNGNRMTADE